MTSEVRQGIVDPQHRDVGAGGEEVFELEKGVRVRKSGGVEFAPSMSPAEIEARQAELQSQIDYQKVVILRAREEAANAARQANEQEILAREALEIKEFNKSRQQEAAAEARALMVEVTALIEKEKELERQRAAAHHAAVEKERERVQAKTAEIIAREEAIEAEKREQLYNDLIRKCQALTLRYKLEEEQAKLKMESLQFNLQHGEFRAPAANNRAKIVVEVEARDLPEARQFDTSQVETGVASAVMGQEGVATIADTRSIEEIVMSERKHRTSASSFSGRGEEQYASREESMGAAIHSAPSSIIPPTQTSGDIKVLPDIKPSASEHAYAAGSASQPIMSTSGEKSAMHTHPYAQQQSQQAFTGGPQQAAGSTIEQSTAAGATAETGQKKKSGFFSKFKSAKSHEQH